MTENPSESLAKTALADVRLSYKFERLRERLRQAVASGELTGKLPGERALAERFGVNPKTLSKALTDLAGEGLLERTIGRGTFVRGHRPAGDRLGGAWLVLCEPDQVESPLVQALVGLHGELKFVHSASGIRPSFLADVRAAVDLSPASAPESFLRGLAVRGIPLALVDREPAALKAHAVIVDRAHAAFGLARELAMGGCRSLVLAADRVSPSLVEAVRAAASRFGEAVRVEVGDPARAGDWLADPAVAFICDGAAAAVEVRRIVESRGRTPGRDVSVAGVGLAEGPIPCSGWFVESRDLAAEAADLLGENPPRPTTLWLGGRFIDQGTLVRTVHPSGQSAGKVRIPA